MDNYVTIRPIFFSKSAFLLGALQVVFGFAIVYSRKIWDLLYSLLPSKKNKQCPETLEVGGDITHDPKLIAQQFCNRFSTIASKIVKDNPNPTSADSFK